MVRARGRAVAALGALALVLALVACDPTGPVSISWVSPPDGASLSGTVVLQFTGSGFRNVEVFRGRFGDPLLGRAMASGDGTSATMTLDTTTLPDGPVSISAHAWDSAPGQPFQTEGETPLRSFTIANHGGSTTTTKPTTTTTTGSTTTTTKAVTSTTKATTTTTAPPSGGDSHPSGYSLAFADEFGQAALDRGQWCTRYIYGGGATAQTDPACTRNGDGTLDFLNDEQERYVDTNRNGEAMHVLSGGALHLRATKTRTNDSYASYESAMIRSKRLFRPSETTSYYLTARVKMPDVVGSWPAFWLNSDRAADGSTTWPPEIDIFDGAYNGKDDRAEMLHQAAIVQGAQTGSGTTEYTFTAPEFDRTWSNEHAASSLRGRWVEVSLEWTASGLCYFIDGAKTACENYRWVTNGGQQAPAAHVLLNLAVGGQWAGRYGIDDAKFPTTFDIDFIRVYQKG